MQQELESPPQSKGIGEYYLIEEQANLRFQIQHDKHKSKSREIKKLLFLLFQEQRSNIVSSSFVVLYMASITQWESSWPPASKISQSKLSSRIWKSKKKENLNKINYQGVSWHGEFSRWAIFIGQKKNKEETTGTNLQ